MECILGCKMVLRWHRECSDGCEVASGGGRKAGVACCVWGRPIWGLEAFRMVERREVIGGLDRVSV